MSSGDRKRGTPEYAPPGGERSNLTFEDILGNPGLLKLELLLRGLRMNSQLLANLIQTRGPSAFATAFELDVTLPEGTTATVPVDPMLTRESPYELVQEEGDDETQYRIVTDTGSVSASLIPPPLFYSKHTEDGINSATVNQFRDLAWQLSSSQPNQRVPIFGLRRSVQVL